MNDNVEVYHIKDDTVYLSRSNPHQAVNFASGLYQGNIVVMNGSVKKYRDKHIITEQVHLFDLHTGYWYQLDNVPCGSETTGVVADSIFYHIGGIKRKAMSYMNAYHITTGKHSFECIFPLYLERPALAYNKGKNIIYIYENSTVFIYNLLTKEVLAYKIDLGLMYSEMIYKDGYLYIIGGRKLTEMYILKENYEEHGDSREYESTFITMPSESLCRIDIKEFETTKSYNNSSLYFSLFHHAYAA